MLPQRCLSVFSAPGFAKINCCNLKLKRMGLPPVPFSPRIGPIAPVVEVESVRRRVFSLRFQPFFRLCYEYLFLFERDAAGQNHRPQEDEIRVKNIATAIVIDLRQSPFVVELLNHEALDFHLAGLAENIGRKVQTAVESGCAKVRQNIEKIKVIPCVVPIPRLFEALGVHGEPMRNSDAVPERREFQQREIEAATVEAHERRMIVRRPTAPELTANFVRTELRLVQEHNVEQCQVGGDFTDCHGDRNLERVRNEVRIVCFPQFFLIFLNGIDGIDFAIVMDFGNQRGIGDALNIEHKKGETFGHGT